MGFMDGAEDILAVVGTVGNKCFFGGFPLFFFCRMFRTSKVVVVCISFLIWTFFLPMLLLCFFFSLVEKFGTFVSSFSSSMPHDKTTTTMKRTKKKGSGGWPPHLCCFVFLFFGVRKVQNVRGTDINPRVKRTGKSEEKPRRRRRRATHGQKQSSFENFERCNETRAVSSKKVTCSEGYSPNVNDASDKISDSLKSCSVVFSASQSEIMEFVCFWPVYQRMGSFKKRALTAADGARCC